MFQQQFRDLLVDFLYMHLKEKAEAVQMWKTGYKQPKPKVDKKALRFPKTNAQWRDRVNWERVRSILVKRYDGKGVN